MNLEAPYFSSPCRARKGTHEFRTSLNESVTRRHGIRIFPSEDSPTLWAARCEPRGALFLFSIPDPRRQIVIGSISLIGR